MSNRHRSSKQAAPGAAHRAPTKYQRKAQNRRSRHRTNELLAHADLEMGEEIVTPLPQHTGIDLDPNEKERSSGIPKGGRDYRHWKQKFWKRRNNVRAARAAMEAREQPLPEVG